MHVSTHVQVERIACENVTQKQRLKLQIFSKLMLILGWLIKKGLWHRLWSCDATAVRRSITKQMSKAQRENQLLNGIINMSTDMAVAGKIAAKKIPMTISGLMVDLFDYRANILSRVDSRHSRKTHPNGSLNKLRKTPSRGLQASRIDPIH